MDRVIFCPDESMIKEAQRLSRLHLAPIQIGESERTKHLEFDRTEPVPLMIPTHHFVSFFPANPTVGRPYSVQYFNDFVTLGKETSVEILNHSIGLPNGLAKMDAVEIHRHRLYFWHCFYVPETFTAYIKNNDVVIDSFQYSVKEEDA